MLRSSHDACGCSTQTTSTINLKRSTLHPHEGQADRPKTPSDSVNPGSNPGPSASSHFDHFDMRTLHRFDKVWLADRALGGTEPLAEEFYYMGLGFPRRTVRIAVVEMEPQNCVRWPR